MTDEQIIQRAREAGMTGEATPAVIEFVRNLLEAEREACAKIADNWDERNKLSNYGRCIGIVIRKRGLA